MLRVAICDSNIQELESTYQLTDEYTKKSNNQDMAIRRFQSSYDLFECLSVGIRFGIYIIDTTSSAASDPSVRSIAYAASPSRPADGSAADASDDASAVGAPHGGNGGPNIEKTILELDPDAVTILLIDERPQKIERDIPSCYICVEKPVGKASFFRALDAAFAQLNREEANTIPVRTKNGYFALKMHQISYVEYYDHRLIYYLSDGSVIRSVSTREPFYSTTKQLIHDARFIRPHIAFVVNMSHVRSITARDFIMLNGDAVPISAKRHSDVKNRFLDFLLKEREKLTLGMN